MKLSPSATTERVRQLEALGVIAGYHAAVDLTKAGYPATSMEYLEELVDQLAGFGSTTTSVVYRQTLPYRGPGRPSRADGPA